MREFAAGDGRVRLLEGRKRGLGAAYVRGITHALDVLGAEVVVQMDADFSHDPADAGRLLARVASDADVAVGSRYAAGGSVDRRTRETLDSMAEMPESAAKVADGIGEVARAVRHMSRVAPDAPVPPPDSGVRFIDETASGAPITFRLHVR